MSTSFPRRCSAESRKGQYGFLHLQSHCLLPEVLQLFHAQLPPPFGLYVPTGDLEVDRYSFAMERNAIINLITSGPHVAGISVALCGLKFTLIIPPSYGEFPSFQSRHVYRPKFINFYERDDVVSLAFAWRGGENQTLWLSRGTPDAAVPNN